MSAIAAVLGADARDHLDHVAAMLDAAAHRAPGMARTWHTGPVVLGARPRRQSDFPSLVHSHGGHAIAFDGRLDNRDDLIATLGSPAGVSDAAIVLAAYERWRDEAPARLLGDFAFAIWDADARRLFCARDAFGQRPLFYAHGGTTVAVASEPQQVLSHPDIPQTINEGTVAEHLAAAPVTIDETTRLSVKRLPPAHVLLASSAGTRVYRYWDFDPDARVEHACAEAYAEQFAHLFKVAVKCRVRDAARGVGVFLSGGVDSSAIAAVAARLHRSGDAAAVHAFSLTFSNESCDETQYIDAVVRHWEMTSTRLAAAAPTRRDIEAEVARYRDLPAFPNGLSLDPLRLRAAADVDVVLTGYGGDDWFSGSRPSQIADLVCEGRVLAAAGQWWADRTLSGVRSRATLARAVIAPLIPRAIKPVARAIAGAPAPAFEWIRPAFAARAGLRDRLRRRERRAFRSHVQQEMYAVASSAVQVIGDELEDRAAAFAGIEQRHPFNDRRVAEFGFALPESERWANGETKAVIRRALASDLPDAVLRRRDKAEFSSTFVDTIEQLGGRAFFDDLCTARAGWVDAAAARAQYDQLTDLYSRGDAAYIALTGSVWAIAAVELWLRHVQGVTS
jgi:asparagine synthase (glutamine-hydrolysing)